MAFTPVWTELSALGLPGLGPSVLPETQTATDTWSLSFTESSSVSTITESAPAVSDTWSLQLFTSAYAQATDQLGATELRALALPGPVALLDGKAFTANQSFGASDTWSLSWTEDPFNLVTLDTTDTWRLTFATETASALVFQIYALTDTWSLQFLDSGSVFASGVLPVAVSDTWSLSFTDSASVSVSLDVTDTWSLSFTDAGVVAVTQDPINVTDTWSLSFSAESGGVTIVATTAKLGSDTWSLAFNDSATAVQVVRLSRMAFAISKPGMTLEIL